MLSGTLTPTSTCMRGGGLVPAPTTSRRVKRVYQSEAEWMLAALVLSNSWSPNATWRLTPWMTSGSIMRRTRRDANTWGARSSLRSSLMASRNRPTTARSTRNEFVLALFTTML
ncbi:hypothetical protein NP493_86g02014 [Ridgeia piscesae]|uniref:Uncharacterized protein n=1 Tax=Ridgeia piscesae TaxID=27915 RepID=A0AAD9UHX8_RIDPI|nr:hypothetical protein NP493_86g02014 [Ridgeia piscesae]